MSTGSLVEAKRAARAAYAAGRHEPAKKTRQKVMPSPNKEQAKELGYEYSVARCSSCRHCVKEKTLLHKQTKNLPVVFVPPVCKRFSFYTKNDAVCDHWIGSDGSTLERLQ